MIAAEHAPSIIPISEVERFQTGDILVTTSIVPLVHHFAIAFVRNGKLMVADNAFGSGKLEVFEMAEYAKMRNIVGIIRNAKTTALTDSLIEEKIVEGQKINYRFFSFNCEDFIRNTCSCNIGLDQRIYYGRIFLGIIIIIILFKIFS